MALSYLQYISVQFNYNYKAIHFSRLNFYRQSFHKSIIYAFTNESSHTPLNFNYAIIDPTHPSIEPNFTYSYCLFDRWFDISFPNTLYLTHIREQHPTEILTLYGLDTLISLYSTILSSSQIVSLVLRILPFRVMQHVTQTFTSYIDHPIITSYHNTQYSSIFT